MVALPAEVRGRGHDRAAQQPTSPAATATIRLRDRRRLAALRHAGFLSKLTKVSRDQITAASRVCRPMLVCIGVSGIARFSQHIDCDLSWLGGPNDYPRLSGM